jgi:site-specific DNA-methyltransferase (adenine-specific)
VGAAPSIGANNKSADISESDSRKQDIDQDFSFSTSERKYTTGFPRCQVCGKPVATGFGTALKPAWEPIVLARKPLVGTVAENVLKHGTGGLNIDGCRVYAADGSTTARKRSIVGDTSAPFGKGVEMGGNGSPLGRWPANLLHDGSDEVLAVFPETKSGSGIKNPVGRQGLGWKCSSNWRDSGYQEGSSGSAARFFYCAKASKTDRDEGCEELEEGRGFDKNTSQRIAHRNPEMGTVTYTEYSPSVRHNGHPTVKPTTLMRYLCRLVTPPGGTVLDPFAGSGSTGKAAVLEGFNVLGIEQDAEYCRIAEARIADAEKQRNLFL